MESLKNKKDDRYDCIDGLRTYAALGIIAMHVLANGNYDLFGFVFLELIPSFNDFVLLFMMVSSFSMCCGYYEKILQCKITPISFYKKRYVKIWPFFAVLIALDLIMSPSKQSLIEAFANLTLCFGLLPNANISVIGVSWTLGVIFVFYLLFPFFCFLLSSRMQGWFVLAGAVLWNWVCSLYFFDQMHVAASFSARTNILYTAVYFVAGGMIYLYRDEIRCKFDNYKQGLLLILVAICGFGYFTLGKNSIIMVLMYGSLLAFAVSKGSRKGLLNNRFTKYISRISMEIYLSHMVIYRVIEKLNLLHIFESEQLSYFVTFLMTASGTVVFSLIVNKGISLVLNWLPSLGKGIERGKRLWQKN